MRILITFGLYIIFLQKNRQDSWSGTPHLEEILDNWVIGSTLAITSITTTWTGIVCLVHDRENQKLEGFLLTDTSYFKLYLGYLMSASVIGFIIQAFMFIVMKLYFYWQANISLSGPHLLQIIGIMVLESLLGANGHLVASDVNASMVSHKIGNYTIDKILSSYEGEEFFTKDYVDGMFNNWSIDENAKVIADEEGGLFYSLTDNHAVLKTYDTDRGQVVEELSLDSPRATQRSES